MCQESDNELEILEHVEIKKHDPGNWFCLHYVEKMERSNSIFKDKLKDHEDRWLKLL